MTARAPSGEQHPDPFIETMLRVLGRAAQALARCGAGDEARRRFDMAITVGERMGPPPSHGGRT